MPELPEVETTIRGLNNYLQKGIIEKVNVFRADLRYEIPSDLTQKLKWGTIHSITRRSKYIVVEIDNKNSTFTALIHLGMSGSMQIEKSPTRLNKHDHVEWVIMTSSGRYYLRYNDPRRFGCIVMQQGNAFEVLKSHKLTNKLGPEPLTSDFNSEYLVMKIHNRKSSIKQLIMNQHIVVGVGNIYASEALFLAKVNPHLLGNSITDHQAKLIVVMIKMVLKKAIEKGGTTLRNFVNSEGKPGYFQQELWVYGREGLLCKKCLKVNIEREVIAQRSTFYCPNCQYINKK